MNKKLALALAAIGAPFAVFAEGNAPTVSSLWQSLGVDLGSTFTSVFSAMASPVGVVIMVVFVMALFYFVLKLGTKAINKRNSI